MEYTFFKYFILGVAALPVAIFVFMFVSMVLLLVAYGLMHIGIWFAVEVVYYWNKLTK